LTEAEVYEVLTQIVRDTFMRDDIELTPDLAAKDVDGWDSFKQIEIILAAEERFLVKIPTREVDALQNVGDLVRAIATRAK